MFGKQVTLVTIFGVNIHIDLSWTIMAILLVWSLAQRVFPSYYPGFSGTTYWWMGGIGAIGFFASLIFHEFWHFLVARNTGMLLTESTVYIFGGVAGMEEEPPSASAEFSMALAGPLASILLGGFLHGIAFAGVLGNWPRPAIAVMSVLGSMNILLALCNLVPAFPLDGGRALRAALWSWNDNFRQATRMASHIGSVSGMALLIVGIVFILDGGFVSGIWWALIAIFLRHASKISSRQLSIFAS